MAFEATKINILMVDDNPKNLMALETILQAEDRNLVRATSGDEALRYLLDHDVAMILLDVYMPGMSGLDTAELIRGREKTKDIPIIFITADSTGVAHVTRGYSLGAVDYILKPIEPDILRSKVAVFVDLYKKTLQIKQQAAMLHEKNIALENANLQRLTMLIDLGQQLAAERDPVKLLEKFCYSARNIVGAEFAAVGLLSENGSELDHFITTAPTRNDLPAVDEKLLHRLFTERRPFRLYDIDSKELAPNSPHPVYSFLGAPIISASEVYGWLYLTNKLNVEEFSEADERLAVTLTSQVAVAYENARLYAELQRHATELSQEIAERKQAEEERAKLLILEQKARTEAERANRAKDEFLATISHELRTPLTAMLGWARMLRSGKLEDELFNRALETIERNAKAQAQLIDDLLDVSRIITGKLRIETRPIELAPIIEAALDAIRPAAEAKSIQLKMDLDAFAGTVSGDPNRLQQVFWNIFSNAVKFTPNGGMVEAQMKRVNSHLEVIISDTGPGISPDFLPHIFDPFRQADGSTTRTHGGLGLGLSIVRHLVELHGGIVYASSPGKGQGSKFTVSLPIVAANITTEKDQRRSNIIESQDIIDSEIALKDLKILVVDDEQDTREFVGQMLGSYGAEIKIADCVPVALDIINSWKPDLLVSDIGMPEEDGYDLIRKIRTLRNSKKSLPAIALTAYASTQDRLRALSAGFQTHVAKPVDPLELVTVILSLVGRLVVTKD
jgi:signal transduction histidine kinase/DNA-binding response OmpR family regulator